jgi:hypothetical protein
MPDTLWMKLRKVRWEDYPVSSSSEKNLPRLLESLASRKEARAMKASHDVWTALCSGQVHPAAEPAFPFLIEILGISQPAVQGEILDIFLKFAEVPDGETAEDWQTHLRVMLKNEHRFFTKLSHSRDEIVTDKARRLLDLIS